MHFEPHPAPAIFGGLQTAAGGANNPFGSICLAPTLASFQLAARSTEPLGQQRIHPISGEADRALRKLSGRRMSGGGKKLSGSRVNGAGSDKGLHQIEPVQLGKPSPTNEFTTDSMSRIVARFPNRDRDAAAPKPNAQRQTGQAPADDRDWSHGEKAER